MRYANTFALGTLLASIGVLSFAATPPTGLDAAARARLVGAHALTLQWLGWGDLSSAGKLMVEDRGDTLSISG